MAQGKKAAAAAAIRRVADETTAPLKRAELLPALVEIMLAVGDLEEARRAYDELDAISESHASDLLRGLAEQAGGAVMLAEGDARAALSSLRNALSTWHDLEVPYEAARTRVLLGIACRRLGDDDAAAFELEAARTAFEELGASPDLTRLDSLKSSAPSKGAHGLSRRELEVLRHVAGGKTNKEIATELVLSERTVERHVSNILASSACRRAQQPPRSLTSTSSSEGNHPFRRPAERCVVPPKFCRARPPTLGREALNPAEEEP